MTDPVLKIGECYRRFTPRECVRIQSFPGSYQLNSVSETRQYKAIGNAVSPVLMWNIANSLVKIMKKKSDYCTHIYQCNNAVLNNLKQ